MRHAAIAAIAVVALVFLSVVCVGCPGPAPWVPDLAGLTQEAAEQAIEDAGFAVGAVGRAFDAAVPDGQVASQEPPAGSAADQGTVLGFVISLGRGPEPTAIVPRVVQVMLPEKADLRAGGVVTSLGAHSVDGNGASIAETLGVGPHLGIVTSPNGNAMLLGWLDDSNQTLSAHTTAEVLLYWASGAFALTPDAQAEIIALLRVEDLGALTAAIASSVAADPDSMAADNPAVSAALQAAMDFYMAQTKSVLITPAEALSGIQIEQTWSANTIRLTNMYRRSAHVYLERTSYTPAGGGAAVPDVVAVTDFPLDPVTGLGSLVETLGDIILGNLAYEYISSKEFRLPDVAGASKTTYTLSVVGMGVGAGDWSRLNAEQQWKQREVAVWFVAKDIVWPIAMDIALPAYSTATGGVYRNFMTYDQPRPALLAEWVETIDNLTGFPEAVASGNVTEATGIALKAMAENGRVQDLTTDILFLVVLQAAQGIDPAGAASGASDAFALAQQIMVAVRVVDVLLASFDVGRIAMDISNSNVADVWDIDVTPPDVRLTPETSTIGAFDDVTLTASIPSAASGSVGEEPVYAYHWKNSGTCGHLSDSFGHRGQEFDSSKDHVLFSADSVEGTDTVTVDVYQIPIGKSQRILLGTATATVTTEFRNWIDIQATWTEMDPVYITETLDPPNGPPSSNWLAYGYGWVFPERPAGASSVSCFDPDGVEYPGAGPPNNNYWCDYGGFQDNSPDFFDLRHLFYGDVSDAQSVKVTIGAMNLDYWSSEEAARERIQLKRDTTYGFGEYEGYVGRCIYRYYYE